jgi:hypothetical protein
MVAPLILSGAGCAMAFPATQSSVLSSVAPQHIGKASGAYSTLRQLGGAFGVAVLVAVFMQAGSYASAQAFSDGFAAAMGACAALSLVGALAGCALPRLRTAGEGAATAVPPPPAVGEAEPGSEAMSAASHGATR